MLMIQQPLDGMNQQRFVDRRRMTPEERVDFWKAFNKARKEVEEGPKYKLAERIVVELLKTGIHTKVEVIREMLKAKVIRLG